jgi:hypothetical protein
MIGNKTPSVEVTRGVVEQAVEISKQSNSELSRQTGSLLIGCRIKRLSAD